MIRSLLLILALVALPACMSADDGFTRVERSPEADPPEIQNGDSQFLAILGTSDSEPAAGEQLVIWLASDGYPPQSPVFEYGYVVCEVADIMNEYEVADDGTDLDPDVVGVADALADAIVDFDIEDPVVSAITFYASGAMNDGEYMLIDLYGSDFRFDLAIDAQE